MEFWNREREIEYLKRYIQSEPNAILFVYGPKSSGKSTLLMKTLEELKTKVNLYYYDLRMVPITSYQDVLKIFFRERGWMERLKKAIPGIAKSFAKYFEVDADVLKDIFDMKYNPFEVMEGVLKSKKIRTGKMNVIVFDELQKLKEVYLNSPSNQRPLVKELFNFFVRLTKVLHLSHVIVMTFDTFFIERVYTDSTLKNTSLFYKVDFFDDETTFEILKDHGFSEKDARYVVDWIGGVPWMIERVVIEKNPRETVENLFVQFKTRVFESVRGRDDLKGILRRVLGGENLYYEEKEMDKVV